MDNDADDQDLSPNNCQSHGKGSISLIPYRTLQPREVVYTPMVSKFAFWKKAFVA